MTPTQFKKLRLAAGYTQTEIARVLEISRMHVWRLENGKTPISKAIAYFMSFGLQKKAKKC